LLRALKGGRFLRCLKGSGWRAGWALDIAAGCFCGACFPSFARSHKEPSKALGVDKARYGIVWNLPGYLGKSLMNASNRDLNHRSPGSVSITLSHTIDKSSVGVSNGNGSVYRFPYPTMAFAA